MQKLRGHGITGNVNRWIESWLSGRQQRVVLNGKSSDWVPVTSGVPQGSVLGPTCFIIFINDIDEVVDIVNGFVFKFADDTKFGRTVISEVDRESMQRDIDNLLNWAETWQMEYNGKKCILRVWDLVKYKKFKSKVTFSFHTLKGDAKK